jgi:hypothetical protein
VVAGFAAGGLPVCLVAEETLPGVLALPAESACGFGITEVFELWPCPDWPNLDGPGLGLDAFPPLGLGLLVEPGAACVVGAGKIFRPLVGGGGLLGSSGGLSGTEGRRCARMSAARIGAAPSAKEGCFSSSCVITSTSSRRLKSAAGFTRILRKSSGPGETFVTVPTGKPLGKI